MASNPSDPKPVLGRVDRDGRLVQADPQLEELQVEAGSRLGASLALPQLAGVVRVAQRLRIPVSRRVLAAGREQDVDMWVRAVPEGDEVALAIERWDARPASPPRLAAVSAVEHEKLGASPYRLSVDEQLRVVTIAPGMAELLGLEPAAAAGQPLTKIFRLEESGDGEIPLLSAAATRSDFAGQRVTDRRSGCELVLDGEAVVGSDGAFSGFDMRAANAGEAAASDPAQPLVDTAIHSALRSPLDSIVRSAEEMIDRTEGPGKAAYADYAADIAAAARHLLSVIRSLGERAGEPGRTQVDLPELAAEAAALLESAAREREIAIAIQPAQELAALGESRGVIQILVNLIGNAIRYSAIGTVVTISFESAGDGTALLHVADEGPGIDPADHDRIFEPFQQGSGGSEGSGLGLSIARRLARSMGGDVRLQSSPGDGARFTLVLPAA
jgi:signal transduction histidine kinase